MSDPRYSPARELGREHFPRTPKGFIAIRIVQLILAVTTLGLDAYVLSIVLYDGAELTIFVVSLLQEEGHITDIAQSRKEIHSSFLIPTHVLSVFISCPTSLLHEPLEVVSLSSLL